MRKLIAVLMIMTLLCGMFTACAEENAAVAVTPVIAYSTCMPWQVAVLLPGVPMLVQDELSGWYHVNVPEMGGYGNEAFRMKTTEKVSAEADKTLWPAAQLAKDEVEYNSMDLNLGYTGLTKDDEVYIIGRCLSSWYVYVPGHEYSEYGAVLQDDLLVDEATAALLNSAMPGVQASCQEVYQQIEQCEEKAAELRAQYGEDKHLWPNEVRAELDAERWLRGFYWENDYAVLPGEDDLTEEEAIDRVKAALVENLGVELPEDAVLNAQLLYKEGYVYPTWHVYWKMHWQVLEFEVYDSHNNGHEDVTVCVDYRELCGELETFEWTLEQRFALHVLAGWADPDRMDGDIQLAPEGMISEADAREMGWKIAGEQLGLTDRDAYKMQVFFYNAGTVLPYSWNWEAWCDDRPAFRINFYTLDENDWLLEAGEIWFDGETGEVYRVSTESSGMG